ncbi:MAG: hypothetical protein LBQ90_12985, partial [Synergistaceae bacterium]|nr:hypothetical protein [Synergistaceae bacterium]
MMNEESGPRSSTEPGPALSQSLTPGFFFLSSLLPAMVSSSKFLLTKPSILLHYQRMKYACFLTTGRLKTVNLTLAFRNKTSYNQQEAGSRKQEA